MRVVRFVCHRLVSRFFPWRTELQIFGARSSFGALRASRDVSLVFQSSKKVCGFLLVLLLLFFLFSKPNSKTQNPKSPFSLECRSTESASVVGQGQRPLELAPIRSLSLSLYE